MSYIDEFWGIEALLSWHNLINYLVKAEARNEVYVLLLLLAVRFS